MRKGMSEDNGPDIGKYTLKAEKHNAKDLPEIEDKYKQAFLDVGYDPEGAERSGSFLQVDHSVLCSKVMQEGVEIMSTTDALEKYSWLSDYWWHAVAPDKDVYTQQVDRKQTHGYFLRTLPGVKTTYPLQSCLFTGQEGLSQNVHNIIIAEEGSELHIITGCSVAEKVQSALHLGVSEFYVKKNAKITFTMIHNWAPEVEVRPRSGIIVEENGVFIGNYVCLNPVKDLQMYPVTYCKKNARATSQSIIYASKDSKIAYGIADSLLTNAVSQAAKARLPIYLYPADQYEGSILTILPDGKELTLYMRDVDIENANRLKQMQGVTVLEQINEIENVVKRHDLETKGDN